VNVRWTDWALEQLEAIEAFVARDDAVAAERLVERIFRRGETLFTHPRRGRVVAEIGRSDVRELILGNYRIIYVIRADRVDVLTILERHRRLVPADTGDL
jgi:toxin ParE1/3/4